MVIRVPTNVSAANSRIRDMDAAEETSNLTKAQFMLQAGVSVLAQAIAVPQVALSLIGYSRKRGMP